MTPTELELWKQLKSYAALYKSAHNVILLAERGTISRLEAALAIAVVMLGKLNETEKGKKQ